MSIDTKRNSRAKQQQQQSAALLAGLGGKATYTRDGSAPAVSWSLAATHWCPHACTLPCTTGGRHRSFIVLSCQAFLWPGACEASRLGGGGGGHVTRRHSCGMNFAATRDVLFFHVLPTPPVDSHEGSDGRPHPVSGASEL